uniref:Uridylate-specific endoribonuclease n=1 Tax=Hucho hucho TaxID=62062 RepID=A0A4W5JRV1_9TELE
MVTECQGVNQELSEVLNQLWSRDTNRLKPGTDYTISLQAGYVAQGSNTARDMARAPLFTYVNEGKLKSIKTYALFMRLLDNYEMSTGVSETVTSEELMENDLFLNAILETEVMKVVCDLSLSVPTGISGGYSLLVFAWLSTYSYVLSSFRSIDSCGFEHVFVGESKYGKEITGFHNWVQFYLQEKLGNVDYKGYKVKNLSFDLSVQPDEDDHVLNLQFSWKGLVKPVGSSFIGVSPEFEVALFTILFLASTGKVSDCVSDHTRFKPGSIR